MAKDTQDQPTRVILLGPPGAGKGTQAHAIASRLEVPHISTGDIFRRAIGESSDLGLVAKAYMVSGELVPDGITMTMVSRRLGEEDASKGFLLDGFPRNLVQARYLDETLRRSGDVVELVLELHVPADDIVRRLSGRRMCGQCAQSWHVEFNPTRVEGICDTCGGSLHRRKDDYPDSVRRRLELHERETAPLAGYYQDKGVLSRVDAVGTVEAVSERVLAVLTAHSPGSRLEATPAQR